MHYCSLAEHIVAVVVVVVVALAISAAILIVIHKHTHTHTCTQARGYLLHVTMHPNVVVVAAVVAQFTQHELTIFAFFVPQLPATMPAMEFTSNCWQYVELLIKHCGARVRELL